MTNEMQMQATETKIAMFSTVEQVKANLTENPEKRLDKRGKEYVAFGIAQNSKNGVAYAKAVTYNSKIMDKLMALKKGDFVKLYGKTQHGEKKTYFRVYNLKKFERKAKEETAVANA